MKVAYSLRPRPGREPAIALLLPGRDAGELFAVFAGLGLEEFPPVYATADGFLLKLPRPTETAVPGVIRLRGLSEQLLLPVDADLVPPLLPDEASALVSKRGLIFLPGERVLEFHPEQPLPLRELLRVPDREVVTWEALPAAPQLAEAVVEIGMDLPPPNADELLDEAGDDIGTELPEPGPAGPGRRALGGMLYGVGKSFAWLGTKLGLRGLAGAGAALMNQAFAFAPRLSEKLMGKQEAMLRELLRDFREGNIDKALRRALPLGGDLQRGSGLAGDAAWPRHRLFYSLKDLLANRRGPASIWFTPDDLYHSLFAEYRKQAGLAARRGDYRRAAFIYARLLNDFASAARILSQGGLHRDAAVLYLEVLHDPRAAARAWESAGEVDRAVALLIEHFDDQLEAAEVLRRVGETERALKHYQLAAAKSVAADRHFEAGEILRSCAERLDLALPYYQQGWATLPRAGALPCGLHLARHFAQEGDAANMGRLLARAEEVLPVWGAEASIQFLNEMVRLSHARQLASVGDDLRDRCLIATARQMEEYTIGHPNRTRLASVFFGGDSPWPAPLVRDGQFAFLALGETAPAQTSDRRVRLGNSTVRASCYLPSAGEIFLGFENGEVLGYALASGATYNLGKQSGPILGLMADASEEYLICLCQSGQAGARSLVGARALDFALESRDAYRMPFDARPRLLVNVANRSMPYYGVQHGPHLHFHRMDNPSWSFFHQVRCESPLVAGMIGPVPDPDMHFWCLLFFEGVAWFYPSLVENQRRIELELGCPAMPSRSTLAQPPLQGWMKNSIALDVTWTDESGTPLSVNLRFNERTVQAVFSETAASPASVAGVNLQEFAFLGPDPKLKSKLRTTREFCNPVAAYPISSTGELLIVDADGTLTRVY